MASALQQTPNETDQGGKVSRQPSRNLRPSSYGRGRHTLSERKQRGEEWVGCHREVKGIAKCEGVVVVEVGPAEEGRATQASSLFRELRLRTERSRSGALLTHRIQSPLALLHRYIIGVNKLHRVSQATQSRSKALDASRESVQGLSRDRIQGEKERKEGVRSDLVVPVELDRPPRHLLGRSRHRDSIGLCGSSGDSSGARGGHRDDHSSRVLGLGGSGGS